MGFGRKGLRGSNVFGRKGLEEPKAGPRRSGGLFSSRRAASGSIFDRCLADAEDMARGTRYSRPSSKFGEVLESLSPEERGELLVAVADKPGQYDAYGKEVPADESFAYAVHSRIWTFEIAASKDHLPTLLAMLIGDEELRKKHYHDSKFSALMRLIDSAIGQGAFLSSGDCEALAKMAEDVRSFRSTWRKADTKKMLARAEKLEKLAGVEVTATELFMQRCEGAENPWAIADKARPDAQFWADLFAETTEALDEIRKATKGSAKPAWLRDEDAFAEVWPAVGEIVPSFKAWVREGQKPFSQLSQHNGKRTGFTEPDAYRTLPGLIPLAMAHSRYNWKSDQIPGLEVLADLENPDWTALVEQLITQRRATKATKSWAKDMLALCEPLGLETVEARLHDWLALFHTPALDKPTYTQCCNGERFAAALDRLEVAHPDWPHLCADGIAALGRAVAMKVASGDSADLCGAFHSQLIRLDDQTYKNRSATDGVLGLPKPTYKRQDGNSSYTSFSSRLQLSVENEEFLRGVVWLVAVMPDRLRAIDALEKVAQTAATYTWTGEEGMRSKIIANAAIATLIAMGGSDVDQAVLRLSKVIENRTITGPLIKHLNADASER